MYPFVVAHHRLSMTRHCPLPFTQAPASLCILRLSAIGDVCHAVAVVQAIQQQWPTTHISWVVGKVEANLLAGLHGIELVVYDSHSVTVRPDACDFTDAQWEAFERGD